MLLSYILYMTTNFSVFELLTKGQSDLVLFDICTFLHMVCIRALEFGQDTSSITSQKKQTGGIVYIPFKLPWTSFETVVTNSLDFTTLILLLYNSLFFQIFFIYLPIYSPISALVFIYVISDTFEPCANSLEDSIMYCWWLRHVVSYTSWYIVASGT